MHKPSLLKKMGIKAVVIQPNHRVADWLWCPCLVPCHVGTDDVVRCICGRSRMCMTMMILRDLPHTCTCTWCLAILGRSPGRALFNVKSRTLRVLTIAFCWWRLQCCRHGNSSLFFFSFLWNKMLELTPIPKQDMDWDRTYFGALTYLPHIWSLQNFKCIEFKIRSVVVPSSRHIEGM